MGYAKNQMMEYEERGFGGSDKVVCHNCIGDEFLKTVIIEADNEGICDYCNSQDNVIELEELMNYIMAGICTKYSRAVDELGYDSREGGYLGETWDTYEVIYDDIAYETDIYNTDILDDLYEMMYDDVWCERDPYALSDDKDDIFTWESFCEQLKHKIRYVFFSQKYSDYGYERYRRPSDILERIGQGIDELNLISIISKNIPIYRGRMHMEDEIPNDSASLGSPPVEYTGYNRMNPEGISMFYGAFDSVTSKEEIWDSAYPMMTIAEFYLTRDIQVIDFTKLECIKYPSLFDTEKYELRMLLNFYKEFVKKITSPVGDKEKLEYISTQVVTEYFRHVYTYMDNTIDGIIYRSSKEKTANCVVIFADNNQCKDDLTGLLYVDKSTITTSKIS